MTDVIFIVIDHGIVYSVQYSQVTGCAGRLPGTRAAAAVRTGTAGQAQTQIAGNTGGVCLAQLLQLGVAGQEVFKVAGTGHEGVFHDDAGDTGLFAAADDPIVVGQTAVGILRVVLRVPDGHTPVLQPQVHQLVQNLLGQLFAVLAQVGTVILVGIIHHGALRGRAGKAVQVDGHIVLCAHALGEGHPLGVALSGGHRTAAKGAGVGLAGHIDRDAGILFQRRLAVLGNFQVVVLLFVGDTVGGAAGSPVAVVVARVQHHHHIAGSGAGGDGVYRIVQGHGGDAAFRGLGVGIAQGVLHGVSQHRVAALVQGGHVKDHVGLFAAGGGGSLFLRHHGVGRGLRRGVHAKGGINADVGEVHCGFHAAIGVAQGFQRVCTRLASAVRDAEQGGPGGELRGVIGGGLPGGLVAHREGGLLHRGGLIADADQDFLGGGRRKLGGVDHQIAQQGSLCPGGVFRFRFHFTVGFGGIGLGQGVPLRPGAAGSGVLRRGGVTCISRGIIPGGVGIGSALGALVSGFGLRLARSVRIPVDRSLPGRGAVGTRRLSSVGLRAGGGIPGGIRRGFRGFPSAFAGGLRRFRLTARGVLGGGVLRIDLGAGDGTVSGRASLEGDCVLHTQAEREQQGQDSLGSFAHYKLLSQSQQSSNSYVISVIRFT